MRGIVVGIMSGALAGGCSVFGIRTGEEPAYTVERRVGSAEIRSYGPGVAAETGVTAEAGVAADEMRARRTGFERLAGYIFGGNSAKQSIAMTARRNEAVVRLGGE